MYLIPVFGATVLLMLVLALVMDADDRIRISLSFPSLGRLGSLKGGSDRIGPSLNNPSSIDFGTDDGGANEVAFPLNLSNSGNEIRTNFEDWYDCAGHKIPNDDLTASKMFDSANCGALFNVSYRLSINRDMPINIGLVGLWRKVVLELSGVPSTNHRGVCPLYPNCVFRHVPPQDPETMDVLVVSSVAPFSTEMHNAIRKFQRTKPENPVGKFLCYEPTV